MIKRVSTLVFVLAVVFTAHSLLLAWVPQVQSGQWAPIQPDPEQAATTMLQARDGAAAVLLPNDRVLIIGGAAADGTALSSAEVFTPQGEFLSAASMNIARKGHTATLLANGRVLVAGGTTTTGEATATVEIFDMATDTWTLAGALQSARSGHTATSVGNDRVVIAGGEVAGVPAGTLEVYDGEVGAVEAAGALGTARKEHAAAKMGDGRVAIFGGSDGNATLATTEIFNPETLAIGAGPEMPEARKGAAAVTLLDGRIFIVGGHDGTQELGSALRFDGVAFTGAGALSMKRQRPAAVLLPHNNSVLVFGGIGEGGPAGNAELYRPWSNTIVTTGLPGAARATPLAVAAGLDGQLLAGGGDATNSAELYGFATIKTDKDDYAPGSQVTITGSGWQPFETVTMYLEEIPELHEDLVLQATADANGNFTNAEFFPEEHHLGVRFYLTAYGSVSEAQHTFTDARNWNLTFLGTGSGSVTLTPSTGTINAPVSCGGTGTAAASQTVTGTCAPNITTSANGATITFSATANPGSTFAGWSNPTLLTPNTCTGTTNPCSGEFTGNGSLEVTFNSPGVTVTPATGGEAIPATTAGGSYTSLTGPVIDENGTAQIGNGTIILNVPAGFQFDTGGTAPTVVVGCLTSPCANGDNINNLATGSAIATTRTASTISVTISAPTASGERNSLTWQNVRVRPTAGTPLATGNITKTGTSTISGVTGSTNFGTLTEVAGAATKLVFTTSPSSSTHGTAFGSQPVVQVQDTFGNVVTTDSSLVTVAIKAGTPLTGGLPGTLQGMVAVNAVNGVATFTGLAIKGVGTGYQLTATDGALTPADSSAFNITQRPITVTAATDTKEYDGTTSSTGTPTVTSGTLAAGDTAGFTQTFDTRHVGTSKTLTPAGTVTDGNSGNNYAVTFANNTTGEITARAITVTASTVTKGYDGTTSSAATPTVTSGTIVAGDTAAFTQTFDTKHVGTLKTLTPAGTVTDGNSGNNYNVTFANDTTGEITARVITVTAATDTKLYDGTTASAGIPTVTSGSLAIGDTGNFTQTFDTKHAGTSKTLAPAGSVVDGNGGNNYSITFATVATGSITARPITVTAATNSKVYDTTTSAAATPTITSGSLAPGDTANFSEAYSDKNAGTGKTLIPSGTVTDGNSGNNYNVTFANDTTGVITAAPVTPQIVANNKTYDGNATATLSSQTVTVLPADEGNVTLNVTEAHFDDANAGTGKTVTATGLSLTGSESGNYSLTSNEATATADITKATAAVVVTPYSETYDGLSHTATVVSITGVNGEVDAAVGTVDVTNTTHTNAGTYTSDYWFFTGTANYYDIGNTTITDTINKADSTTTVTCPAGPYVYTGLPFTPCSATVTGAGGLNETPTPNYTDNTNAGLATASYTYAGGANHNGSSNSDTFTIDPAPSVTTVTCPPGPYTYTGSAQTPCSASVTGVGGLNLTPTPTYVNNVNAGLATASYAYAGDANHEASNDSDTFTIDPAPSVTTVTCPPGPYTYTGSAYTPCSASVTGVGGLNLTPTPTYVNNVNAGTATASYAYAGDANHEASNDSDTFTIDPAPSVTTVTCPAGPYTYTGSAQTPCSASVTGVGGLNLTPTPTYVNNVNAGTATASYAYAGDANHEASNDSDTFTIDPAPSVTTVTCPAGPFTYTGSAQTPCSVSVTGAGGLSLTPTPTYVNNVNAGLATASYAFAASANHTGSNASDTFTIGKANATFTVTPYNVTYDGLPHTATVSAITGVNGETGATVGTVNVSATTHTSAGTYASDSWTFTGGPNYNNQGPITITDTIAKANPTCTINGFTGVYDGLAHGASGSCTGVSGETLSGLNLGASFTLVPGGTATWVFTDVTGNYNNTSGGVAIVITTAFCFTGFLAPIDGSVEAGNGGSFANPVRAFKLGSTVPVKFSINSLSGTCGEAVTTGIHTLQAIKYSSAIDSDPAIDATPTDAATTGNQFKLTGSEWHYNLSTKTGFSVGTWLLRATLQDGSVKTVWITIKK